jgi:carbon storage regulator
MLVLSRQKDEDIEIGGLFSNIPQITIKVVDVKGNKVKLGITAPKPIPVHRSEIADQIRRELASKKPPTE